MVRDTYSPDPRYDTYAPLHIDKRLQISSSPILQRPILSKIFNWTTTDTRYKILQRYDFPSELISSSPLAVRSFSIAALYRTKACVRVTCTGTIAHQGMLLVGVLPLSQDVSPTGENIINTLMTAPHAFLAANETSSACIEVPFMSSSQLLPTNMVDTTANRVANFMFDNTSVQGSDFASIVIMVLNPLNVAGGTGNTVTVTVHTEFKDLELYVPRNQYMTWTAQAAKFCAGVACACATKCLGSCIYDNCFSGESSSFSKIATGVFDGMAESMKSTSADIIDALRGTLRSYTGLHNPNDANLTEKMISTGKNSINNVDVTNRYTKLDPYANFDRIINDDRLRTRVDEMLTQHIVSKPQYVGTFSVSTANTSGALLFSRPISPHQGYSNVKNSSPVGQQILVRNNIEHLYNMTRSWSGTIKIHIQSVMTAKHSVKFQLSRYYVPALNAIGATGTPNMQELSNNMTEFLEFSQGNQILTVDMPFCSQLRSLYNTKSLEANAYQHGIYYIHLAQPLVIGDNVPTTAEFNVYISCGEDFMFYGYNKDCYMGVSTPAFFEEKWPAGWHNEYIHNATNKTLEEIHKEHFEHLDLQQFLDINSVEREVLTGDMIMNKIRPFYGSYTSKILHLKKWPHLQSPAEFKRFFGTEFRSLNIDRNFDTWPVFNFKDFNKDFKNIFKFSPKHVGIIVKTEKDWKDWLAAHPDVKPNDIVFMYEYNNHTKTNSPSGSAWFFGGKNGPDDFRAESAEVMNAPSDPVELTKTNEVVKLQTCSELLKPMISIRDLIRRFTNRSSSPFTVVGKENVVVHRLLRNISTGSVASAFDILTNMFLGYEGGFKFKVLVTGYNGVSVAYNAPGLGYYLGNLTRNTIVGSADEFNVLQSQYQMPMNETPDTWMVTSNSVNRETAGYCLIEGVVPNVNPAEFLSQHVRQGGNFSWFASANPGELLLIIPNINNAVLPEVMGNYSIRTAATDETRLCMHIRAPVVALKMISGALVATADLATDPTGNRVDLSILPTQAPYAYYSSLTTSYN